MSKATKAKPAAQATVKAEKKARKTPVANETTEELIRDIEEAELSLEQLRILERKVAALKKAAQPAKGESKNAQTKANSAKLHANKLADAKSALKTRQEAKAKEALTKLPMALIKDFASQAKIIGRSKMAKFDLIAAIVADAMKAASVAKAA